MTTGQVKLCQQLILDQCNGHKRGLHLREASLAAVWQVPLLRLRVLTTEAHWLLMTIDRGVKTRLGIRACVERSRTSSLVWIQM